MPVLKIQTNQSIAADELPAILTRASEITAGCLGKPESYVMVDISHSRSMVFAGSDDPLAYLELKSIGLPADKTADLSASLCSFIEETLAIHRQRIYIEFSDAPRNMFGWNGGTF